MNADALDIVTLRAAEVASLAMASGTSLVTAESCTGGLVAALLAQQPGVSAVLLGGIVAYANEVKRDLLGVPEELLVAHGAVSEPVALAMARGACRVVGAALAVATTGVAGPGGGSVEKPVGLVYIAVATGQDATCWRFRFDGDRAENILAATGEALRVLRDRLSTLPG